MMEPFFETKGLSVGYNGETLIRDISVRIGAGEVVALIGPNGSGKSTILKTITKHLAAVRGSVYIGRDELGRLTYRELSRRVSVVLTDRIRPELMTCRDVVASGRYPYTGRMGLLREEDERIVDEAMLAVHVLDLASRSFDVISDGQRQRILLARAICQQPEILVLDEPTSFLDIRHKVELLALLREMARTRGTIILLSLHEIDLAQKVADKLLCVRGDTIARFGAPDEVLDDAFLRTLYDLDDGIYNLRYGSIELPRPAGEPKTFVLSGCGSGVPVFRALQKRGEAFYAGILYENDLDYPIAQALAAEVVTEKPFCPISPAALTRAMALLERCDRAILCAFPITEQNGALRALVEAVKAKG